ncbi:MAG: hypothetical protein DLM57_06975 [Pseudonocardiales bacterium]|nr:MAG: hypothetical protein DLM57_06975 [Pseudonocardiales bacterium]
MACMLGWASIITESPIAAVPPDGGGWTTVGAGRDELRGGTGAGFGAAVAADRGVVDLCRVGDRLADFAPVDDAVASGGDPEAVRCTLLAVPLQDAASRAQAQASASLRRDPSRENTEPSLTRRMGRAAGLGASPGRRDH